MSIKFILESRIHLLLQGRSFNPLRILFGFKSRKTSSQVIPHKVSEACHSTTQGRGLWWEFLRAKTAKVRWVRVREKSTWTTVPLQSGRLQRAAMYAVNFAQKFMSSSIKALAVLRYTFSFFTYSGLFFCFSFPCMSLSIFIICSF